MGKREIIKKTKSPRDYYRSIDPDAVKPLLPYIAGLTYIEPCAGAGDLVSLINNNIYDCTGKFISSGCVAAYDIEPQVEGITQRNCLTLSKKDLTNVDVIITNPPFSKDMLLPVIEHLSSLRPTWLLLPADLMHNIYMKPYLNYCDLILSIGRLCWFKDDKGKMVKGVDNYMWARFDQSRTGCDTIFKGRV